jgi:hypothetical protein
VILTTHRNFLKIEKMKVVGYHCWLRHGIIISSEQIGSNIMKKGLIMEGGAMRGMFTALPRHEATLSPDRKICRTRLGTPFFADSRVGGK